MAAPDDPRVTVLQGCEAQNPAGHTWNLDSEEAKSTPISSFTVLENGACGVP